MSKFGSDTNDKISPLFTSISSEAPPLALKVIKASLSSLLIKYWIFVSKVNSRGCFDKFLSLSSLSKYFSTPEIP